MDNDSSYIHRSHNVPKLLYHFFTPMKYRRLAITEGVEGCIRQICEAIELRWDRIRFIEVGTYKDHVHYPLQSTPDHSPAEIVRLIKSVTAKSICRIPRSEKYAMGRRILERRLLRVECRQIYK